MRQIVEIVPNFSEGRSREILAALEDAAGKIPGAALLDIHTDPDHNRSVFTLAGSPESIEQAAFVLAEAAVRLIDLRKHKGEHPRIGAMDVLPFVPVKNITMEDCAEMARRTGERIARELSLPVYLYEEAAAAPERKNLANIRKGAFNQIGAPDFGSNRPHTTAGATAVGARKPLIAFNINLNTSDVRIAKAVAKSVRESSGGLKHCKALGIYLKSQNKAQVSMNLTDCEQTPIYQVFKAVKAEAAKHGAEITESELIGLVPAKALIDCAGYFLRLDGVDLGDRVLDLKVGDLI